MAFLGAISLIESGIELWQTTRLIKGLEAGLRQQQDAVQSELSALGRPTPGDGGAIAPQAPCADAILPRRPPSSGASATGMDGLL
ncbi:MAG: hypothetical protein GIW99_12840 [Candidatus Eremiobacteraeota bacterium]|nr:hypothetical protein [Candidatus Eremiobacteraeota bacterium]MBC5828546.1 hypothetical protein [Candidatus Eremiobacteraeota bacterium]